MRRPAHLAARAGLVAALGAAVVAAAGSVEPAQPDRAPVRSWPASPYEGSPLPADLRVPDVALRDEDGETVRLADVRGPAIVMFGSAVCEESCPLTAQMVRGALDDLGRDLPAFIVAVDPPQDTPASARRFLAEQQVIGRLRFLLGSQHELERAWRGFAVAPQTAREHHQARIVLIDDGRQRVGWFAQQATPEALARDLEQLLVSRRTRAGAGGVRAGAGG